MPSVIDTCNEALAEIGAGSIAALTEPSIEAAACKRFYQSCVRDMIEMHDWGFAKRRTLLARIINDRPHEWLYSYAKPADVGSLVAIVPSDGRMVEGLGPLRYAEEAGAIYTNVARAMLEYTTQAVEPGDMPALFRRALVYELASRLAMPVMKDRKTKGDMIQLSTAARREAMADDLNRNPRQQVRYMDEITRSRLGIPEGEAVQLFEPMAEIVITINDD
jgi:hypothetical protein